MSELQLKHFRSFVDSGPIRLGRLTLLFGRNNSGKSTVLQSLLLLKQTIEAPQSGPLLNSRGTQYDAGGYTDLVHMHRAKGSFEWRLKIAMADGETAQIRLEFVADSDGHLARLSWLRIEHPSADPIEFVRGPGKGGPYAMRIGSAAAGGQAQANFSFSASGFFPLIGSEPPKVGAPNKRRAAARVGARDVLSRLETIMRQSRAVGAFRPAPTRLYEYAGRSAEANVIDALIHDTVKRGRKGDLIGSVNRWLKLVGRVRLLRIASVDVAGRIFELRLRDTDSGRWANFADVGFGIGQALPVIVDGLRTPVGAMFLVQEPEIHLHPDAQLAMADFLVDLALSGRQVIAETHSEAILLRVRQRIATLGKGRLPADQASIVVVDKKGTGGSFARALEPDELGQIGSWPKGFMEDANRERMRLLDAMATKLSK